MTRKPLSRWWLWLLLAGCLCPAAEVPRLWIWAWDRPENLTFIQPGQAGVAYFALGLKLEGGRVQVRPRMAPLRMPEHTPRIAVVRIDVSNTAPNNAPNTAPNTAAPSTTLLKPAVDAILRYAIQPEILELQIDFDATRSQRDFYRSLLHRLRERVSVPISITALASWCMGDPWIRDLPVAETVPMLFQMGEDMGNAHAWLRERRPLRGPAGSTLALGIATNEPLPVLPGAKRIFVFHSRSWSKSVFDAVYRRVSS